jgi:hypothetical protein
VLHSGVTSGFGEIRDILILSHLGQELRQARRVVIIA